MVVRLLNPRPYLYVQYSFEVKGPMTGSSLVSARLVFTLHRFGEKEHYVACMLLKPRPKDDSRVVTKGASSINSVALWWREAGQIPHQGVVCAQTLGFLQVFLGAVHV